MLHLIFIIMINSKVNLSLILFLLFPYNIFSQSSFELEYGTEHSESFSYSFDDNNGSYITVGGYRENFGIGPGHPLAIKINSSGNIENEKFFTKQDTLGHIFFGYQKGNGNYSLIGTLSDSIQSNITNSDIIYFCEVNQELEILWEKFYVIPEPYINIQLLEFVFDTDSNLIIEGRVDSTYGSYDDLLCILKTDQMGNVLSFNLYDDWHDAGAYNVFMHNFDSTGFVLLGEFSHYSFYKEWIELDTLFSIQSSIPVIDPQQYIVSPISARWLPNGNIITACRDYYYNLYVKIMDPELNTVTDTVLEYPETVYVAVNYGIDYTDENNIYIGTFTGIPPGWTPGSEIFRIHIFDKNGHLKGMKEFGGDVRYWFYNLKATSDGGCIMTGYKDDYYGSINHNGYVIKVMPDDIVTNAEDTPFEFDRDVSVYPNPFNDYLKIETARKNLRFSLFDINGKMVNNADLDTQSKELTTGNLNSGFYFYNVTDNGRIIQSGKLIKK